MDRLERLKKTLEFIEEKGTDEANFDLIHNRLVYEIQCESKGVLDGENQYLNGLKCNKENEADDYKIAKRANPKSAHLSLFDEFVFEFKLDVTNAIEDIL